MPLLSEKAKSHLILIIGQSTCPACQIDHYALQRFYIPWKSKGYQIVYVSIDDNEEDYKLFYSNDPWETYHNKKGWKSQLAKSLHLIATPTLFCFNSNMELLKEAENAHQMHIWIESQLQ